MSLYLCLADPLEGLISLGDGFHLSNIFLFVESNLSDFHGRCFFKICPHGINYVNSRRLAALDAVLLHKLATLGQNIFRDHVQRAIIG